jgi:hypothetical protein
MSKVPVEGEVAELALSRIRKLSATKSKTAWQKLFFVDLKANR